jgi:predicted RNA-binding protein YlxR (DUF448 family)
MGRGKGHVPVRTCISCGAKRSKKEFFRLIFDSEGRLALDVDGKGQGRGSYVCKKPDCLKKLGTGDHLKKAFGKKVALSPHPELRAVMKARYT